MDIYYIINGSKYLDTYLLREKLELNKSELQHLMTTYQFPQNEIITLQNRKLYSMNSLNDFIVKLLAITNER